MIIAISQPTFLPYEGYFALVNNEIGRAHV